VIALDPHRNNSQPQAASAPPAGEASRIVDDYVLKVAQVGTCARSQGLISGSVHWVARTTDSDGRRRACRADIWYAGSEMGMYWLARD